MNALSNISGVLAIAAIVLVLGYSLSCWLFPFTDCRSCRGRGIFRSALFGAIRDCRRCQGTGRILRIGRRLYNRFSRIRHTVRADRQRGNRLDDNH